MKNFEAINLYKFLTMGEGSQAKWDFASTRKLRKILEPLAGLFEDMKTLELEKSTENPLFTEFSEALLKKLSPFFLKDQKGEIQYDLNGNPLIQEDKMEAAQEERKKLAEDPKFKEAIEQKDKKEEEWLAIMRSDIDFDFEPLPKDSVDPNLKLSNVNWDMLEMILED